MSVWDEIDKLKRRHDREYSDAARELEGGVMRAVKGSLRTDEFGLWRCRYIPKGQRAQVELSARTAADLVERLKEIRRSEGKGG